MSHVIRKITKSGQIAKNAKSAEILYAKLQQIQPTPSERAEEQKISLGCALYLHRQQLARRRRRSGNYRQSHAMPLYDQHLADTKLLLTDELINSTKRNIYSCSMEDLQIVNREIIFKKRLNECMQERLRRAHQMRMMKFYEQAYKQHKAVSAESCANNAETAAAQIEEALPAARDDI